MPGIGITKSGVVWSFRRSSPRQLAVVTREFGYVRYRCVAIYDALAGHSRTQYLHRLLAKTFIKNPRRLRVVGHKNLQTLDNRLTNLHWTRRKSIAHKIDRKSVKTKRLRRLTSSQVRALRRDEKKFTRKELGKKYGIGPNHVRNIVTRRSYRSVR